MVMQYLIHNWMVDNGDIYILLQYLLLIIGIIGKIIG